MHLGASLDAPPRKIERVVLLDQVHEVLKERILDRRYRPGEKLSIDALARELHVSSTPIREALGRLTAEELVRAEPFVGFSVAAMPSQKYYADLCGYRLVVEPWAAAETARLRPPAVLAELEATIGVMAEETLDRRYSRYRGFSEADEAFHDAIMAGTGNEPALKAFRGLRVHLHMSRLYILREQDAELARAQHLAILDAIRAASPEAAAAAMREHLVTSRQRLVD
jgi:DNA-binding GntR family transcriptional regulator